MRHVIVEENKEFAGPETFLEPGACWWTDESLDVFYGYGFEKPLAKVTDIRREGNFITAEITNTSSDVDFDNEEEFDEFFNFTVAIGQLARGRTSLGFLSIQKGRIISVNIVPKEQFTPGFPVMPKEVDVEIPYYGD